MAGELIVRKGGYLGVEDSDRAEEDEQGRFQIFTDKPEECCCCDPCKNEDPRPNKTLHTWVADTNYRPPENLERFRKKGECFAYWQIVQGSGRWDAHGCYLGATGAEYEGGVIEDGELIGLPGTFGAGEYYYQVSMSLLLFCCHPGE